VYKCLRQQYNAETAVQCLRQQYHEGTMLETAVQCLKQQSKHPAQLKGAFQMYQPFQKIVGLGENETASTSSGLMGGPL
jgi:hypothetical protein